MKVKQARRIHKAFCLTAFLALSSIATVIRADETDNSNSVFNAPGAIESCVIKTTWDKGVSSLSPEVIEALLQSSGVWGRAVEEIFGDGNSGDIFHSEVRLETLNVNAAKHIGGDSLVSLVGRLIVEIETEKGKDVKIKTRILLKRVCDLLQNTMLEFAKDTIRGQHERKAQITEELDRVRGEVHRILTERQAFLDKNDSTELDHRRITQELRELERRKSKMEIERSVAKARRAAMEVQIARLAEEAKVEPIQRTDLAQMQKIIAIRQKALRQAEDLAQQGLTSAAELNQLQIEVAQAEAELARAEADAQREHTNRMREMGGDFIIQMNHELTQMAIDDADMEAKLRATIEMIEKSKSALKVAEQYEQLGGHRLDIARDRLEDVQRNLAELERRIATTVRPKMTIVGIE